MTAAAIPYSAPHRHMKRSATAMLAWWVATFEARSPQGSAFASVPRKRRCTGRRKGKRCASRVPGETIRGEWACSKCGHPWPTDRVQSRGTSRRLAASIGHDVGLRATRFRNIFESLTRRQQIICFAWETAPRIPGETIEESVAEFLGRRFPRRQFSTREVFEEYRNGMQRIADALPMGE